jgi:hypothetical protein
MIANVLRQLADRDDALYTEFRDVSAHLLVITHRLVPQL